MHVRELRTNTVPELDKYIILDTQGGQEDVVALIAALNMAAKEDRTVLGITCVGGRRKIEDCVNDALVAQQIAGTSVPVFKGSQRSILLKQEYPKCIDLEADFKELDSFPLQQNYKKLVQKQSAVTFIANSIKKFQHQLCIASFGPLTNLALAFHLNQCNLTHQQISSVRINGGCYTGVGNVVGSPIAEGNFYYDPEAAHIVFTNFDNIYVNPIERSLETSLREQIKDVLENSKVVAKNQGLSKLLQWLIKKEYCICGPLLNILPIFNKLIAETEIDVYSEVIRTGYSTSGLMAPNWLRLQVKQGEQKPNTKIYSTINRKILSKLLWLAFD